MPTAKSQGVVNLLCNDDSGMILEVTISEILDFMTFRLLSVDRQALALVALTFPTAL